MNDGIGREISREERITDRFIGQLDTVRSRGTVLLVASLAVILGLYQLTSLEANQSIFYGCFWLLVVLGNSATVYSLSMYQKSPSLIEQSVFTS